MASVTGQCPSQPEMHVNRAEYDTGRLYLVDGVGRGTTADSVIHDPSPLAAGTARRSRSGHRPEPRITSPFAGFLKRAALVTVAEVGVSTARVSLRTASAAADAATGRRAGHAPSRLHRSREKPGREPSGHDALVRPTLRPGGAHRTWMNTPSRWEPTISRAAHRPNSRSKPSIRADTGTLARRRSRGWKASNPPFERAVPRPSRAARQRRKRAHIRAEMSPWGEPASTVEMARRNGKSSA